MSSACAAEESEGYSSSEEDCDDDEIDSSEGGKETTEGVVLGDKGGGEGAGAGQHGSNGIASVHHEGSLHEGLHHGTGGMSRAGGVVAVRAAHLLSRLLWDYA
jgi:hypothetical protein